MKTVKLFVQAESCWMCEVLARYGLPGGNAPLIYLLISALYKLFVCSLNFLPYSLLTYTFFAYTFFLVYFLTYLSAPSRIDLFHFQARHRRRRPNLALVFFGLSYVVVYFFTDACFAFVVFVLVFSIKPRDRLGRMCSNDLFCVGWDVKP